MKKKEFLSGVISLTLSMLIIQSSSMAFSVFVSAKAGAEAMGVFHLIMSVFSFAVTVAISGVPLAATRLVSETKKGLSAKYILKKVLILSSAFGMFSGSALFVSAPAICRWFLKNNDALIPLRILAVSLPFTAVSAAVRGYFTGFQKISCIVAGKMVEDFSYMLITLCLMKIFGMGGNVSVLLSAGIAVSAAIAFAFDISMCLMSVSRHTLPGEKASYMSVLAISAPVAAGSYLRSSLTAAENIMVPLCLAKSGIDNAIAQYGVIKGMAMPVLTFPYVFLQSFISLLIPEISGRNARENKKSVKRAISLSIRCTAFFGVTVAVILLLYGRSLGLNLYKNPYAAKYITALALLAIPMYTDSVTDGLLKGMNEQVYSLKINIVDSLIRLPVIWLLLPAFGGYGYIALMYISELLNFALSYRRLKQMR